jgi:hypothetical protein
MLSFMNCRPGQSGKSKGARTSAAPVLLEVWLELLEKIEGPRRRRATELRRRQSNPVRRPLKIAAR